MNFRRYLIILAVFLITVLTVQPALSADNMTNLSAGAITGIVTNNTAGNVTKIVTDYTPELQNDTATKFFNYGQESIQSGDYNNAITYFDQALAGNTTMLTKTPALQYLYQGKSYAQIQLEKYNDAVTTTDEGLLLYPKDAILWNNQGFALYHLGKPQDALAAYDKAISFDGNYTNAYINQGNVLSDLGRYQEAITAYSRANDTEPFNIAASDGIAAAEKGEAGSNQAMTILVVIVLIAAAGIGIWYVKIRKPAVPAPEEKKKKPGKK